MSSWLFTKNPQANGQVRNTNKILCTVLTKVVENSRMDWELKLHSALWAYRVEFKTALGTTPYKMVFGLDVILPLEFLIPTLRVAKELEWTGHEFSTRLEELEKLDETRLRVVAGMYAQKQRQKKFHDAHVKNKEFKIGDLFLVYTLKQHASKPKKRGNGPYAIHDISTSGAVRLATLDGEQMLNWMSGCRLKKYHKTLTLEMLDRIHAAKQCKDKAETLKEEALQESQERAQKCKKLLQNYREANAKFPRICQLQSDSEKGIDVLKPYIRTELGTQQIPLCFSGYGD